MKDSGIDKLFKDALYNMEQPVDANLWGKIERSVRMRRIKRVVYIGWSVAAVILLGLFLAINPFEEKDAAIDIVSQVNVVSESEERVEVVKESTANVKESDYIALADDASQRISKPAAKKAVEKRESLQDKDNAGSKVDEEHGAATVQKESEQNVQVGTKSGEPAPAKEEKRETAKETEKEAVSPQTILAQNTSFVDFEEDTYIAQTGKKPYTIALSSNIAAGRGNVNANENFRAPLGLNGNSGAVQLEQVSEVQYSLPLNLGVHIQFPIRGFISVGTGLNYSMLVSKYDALLDKQMVNVNQTLHYMGIPVNVYFRLLEKSNFNVYANAGVALEWGLGSSYKVESYNFNRTYKESIDGVLFSMNAGFGVEYIFGNLFGLYIEPNVVYYPNSKVKRSIRTDQPLQIRAEIGCRFHF